VLPEAPSWPASARSCIALGFSSSANKLFNNPLRTSKLLGSRVSRSDRLTSSNHMVEAKTWRRYLPASRFSIIRSSSRPSSFIAS